MAPSRCRRFSRRPVFATIGGTFPSLSPEMSYFDGRQGCLLSRLPEAASSTSPARPTVGGSVVLGHSAVRSRVE